jgi:hypothetical protein
VRRLALLGLLLALPFVAVPLVWAAAGGGARDGSLTEFRQAAIRPAPAAPRPPVERIVATPTRVSFAVTRQAGVEVSIRDRRGALVRRLGHFTVTPRRRLVLTWDGTGAPAGSVAVVRVGERSYRAPVRRFADADDADRESLRQPGDA